MKIRYCVVTLNQVDWLVDKHLASLDTSVIDGLHLHFSEVEQQQYQKQSFRLPLDIVPLNQWLQKTQVKWTISASMDNYGVSCAWNQFVRDAKRDGYDAVIIANDDIMLYRGTVNALVESLKQDHKFVYAETTESAFTLFGMRCDLVDEIGPFDEKFWPAYFEDNDYRYRLRLAGIMPVAVQCSGYLHAKSATLGKFGIERKLMHFHNFDKNEDYYVEKWGGLPDDEKYTTPFNAQVAD